MHLYEDRPRLRCRGILMSAAFFAMLALVFWASLGQIERQSGDRQAQLLEAALQRAAITCYAIEGRYPPSLHYITDHYSVVIDEEKYLVIYDAFAENIMPTLSVQIRGATLS